MATDAGHAQIGISPELNRLMMRKFEAVLRGRLKIIERRSAINVPVRADHRNLDLLVRRMQRLRGQAHVLRSAFVALRPVWLATAGAALFLGQALVHVVGSLAQASAAAMALPVALGAVMQGVLGLGIAINGFSKAMREWELFEDLKEAEAPARMLKRQLAKAEAAMVDLGESGREFVLRMRKEWVPALRELQIPVRDAFFRQAVPAMELLMEHAEGFFAAMEKSAEAVGKLGLELAKMVTSPIWRQDLVMISDANIRILHELGDTALNLLDIIRNLWGAAIPLTVQFVGWLSRATGRLRELTEEARQDGRLVDFFNRAGAAAAQWGRIVGNVSIAIFNTFRAIGGITNDFVDDLEEVTFRWREWTESDEGQRRMHDFFQTLRDVDWTGLAKAFGVVAATLAAINVARSSLALLSVLFSPAGLFVAGLAGLIASLGTLYVNNEDFRESVNDLWNLIVDELAPAIAELMGHIEDLVIEIGQAIGFDWEDWADVAKSAIGGITETVGFLTDALQLLNELLGSDPQGVDVPPGQGAPATSLPPGAMGGSGAGQPTGDAFSDFYREGGPARKIILRFAEWQAGVGKAGGQRWADGWVERVEETLGVYADPNASFWDKLGAGLSATGFLLGEMFGESWSNAWRGFIEDIGAEFWLDDSMGFWDKVGQDWSNFWHNTMGLGDGGWLQKLFTGNADSWGAWTNMISEKWGSFSDSLGRNWSHFWRNQLGLDPDGGWFSTLMNGAGHVWSMTWRIALGIWNNFTGALGALWESFWGGIVEWFHENLIQPIKDVWNHLFGNPWMLDTFNEFVGLLTSAWHGVWNTLKSWFDENFIQPIETLWSNLWSSVQDVWDGISSFFTDTIPGVFEDMKNELGDKFNSLGGGFTDVVNGIAEIFSELPSKISESFNAALGVIKDFAGKLKSIPGVGSLLDKVAKLSSLAAPAVSVAKSVWGAIGFASGGFVNGPGTSTSDSITARLSKGEFVMNAKAVKRLGVNTMDAINRGMYPEGPGLQTGGSVDEIIAFARKSGQPANVTSSYRNTPDYHGQGLAVDFGGYNQDKLANHFMAVGKSLLELIHQTNQGKYGVKHGRNNPSAYNSLWSSGDDSTAHRNHVHVAARPGFTSGASGAADFAGASGSFTLQKTWKKLGQGIWDKLKGGFSDFLKPLDDMPFGPAVRNMMTSIPGKILGFLDDKDPASSAVGGLIEGSGPVMEQALKQAQAMSATKKVLLALFEAGFVESNFRNLGHQGSANDHDSLGFLQQRPSMGWGTAAQIMNVPHATRSFVSRAMPIQGSHSTAGRLAQAVQRSAFPERYDQAESRARAALRSLGVEGFDSGGLLGPGMTPAVNETGGPEAVLTRPQWAAMMSLAGSVDQPINVNVNVDLDGEPVGHRAKVEVDRFGKELTRELTARR